MATFRKRSDAWQARIQRNGYPDQSKTFSTRSEALASTSAASTISSIVLSELRFFFGALKLNSSK